MGKEAQKIGFLGDTHGDLEEIKKTLSVMKSEGVTHIVGIGDFIGLVKGEESEAFENPHKYYREQLKSIFQMIKDAGFEKEQIHLLPGNWELGNLKAGDFEKIANEFGQVITTRPDDAKVIELGVKRVMVSHYPMIKPPERLLPPEKMRRQGYKNMDKFDSIPNDVDLVVYGHTHFGGAFQDPNSLKFVANIGTITDYKDRSEHKSFLILDEANDNLDFFRAETKSIAHTMSIKPKKIGCLEMVLRDYIVGN